MGQVEKRKLKRGATKKDKSIFGVIAPKENSSNNNLYREDKFKQDHIKYRSKKSEQILKSNLSQFDKMEDQISCFFNTADYEMKALEAPTPSLSANSSLINTNEAMNFDDPLELFAHIKNIASGE